MSSESESIQAKRLQWLISKIKEAEENVHDTVDDFYMQAGKIMEAHAANDALDALREAFPMCIPELSEATIDAAMEKEKC